MTDSDAPATVVVTLDGATHELPWPRGARLLDVLLDAGLDAPSFCREGHCGACVVTKQAGEIEMAVNDVLDQAELDEGFILACQSTPRSDLVQITYD